jgi:hypothetical protein
MPSHIRPHETRERELAVEKHVPHEETRAPMAGLVGAGKGKARDLTAALGHLADGARDGEGTRGPDADAEERAEPVPAAAANSVGGELKLKPAAIPEDRLNAKARAEVDDNGSVPVQLVSAKGRALLSPEGALSTGEAGQGSSGIDWSTGELPEDLDSRVEQYQIQSVVQPDGSIVVTSNNIRVQVQSLGPEFDAMFAGKSEAEINAMLEQWRARKDADDALGYGNLDRADPSTGKVQGTGDLRDLSRQSGYYGSEQHMVWAYAASARTGGRIPPEFFLELDPFGGTAGNGPEIQPGGGAGGPLSTIAMGHDTDWTLGRLMGVGPLQELHDLDPQNQLQMKLMGPVGLMDGNAAFATVVQSLPPELAIEVYQAGQSAGPIFASAAMLAKLNEIKDRLRSDPAYAPFFAALDANTGADLYTLPRNDWNVQYTPEYISQQTGLWNELAKHLPYTWSGPDSCPAVLQDDLGELIEEHSPGHGGAS